MPGFTIGPVEERVPGANNARVRAFTSTGARGPWEGKLVPRGGSQSRCPGCQWLAM